MPHTEEFDALQEQFDEVVAAGDNLRISELLNDQNISDVVELIYENPEHESQIISSLATHRAAGVFRVLDVPAQKDIIHALPAFKTAELLNELPADDRTSFLEELPSSVVKELIKLLDPQERKVTLSLLGYQEGSVGRLMTPEYIAVGNDWTVQEVLDHIREVGKDSETIDVIYVVDDRGVFLDDIRIKEFLFAKPDKLVSDLVDGRYITLHAGDDQESAYQVFKMNNRVALPVLDDADVLLGIVTIDDVLWVASEEFSEDVQKLGGTEALGEPYLEIPLLKLVRKRAGWLIILFFSEMLTTTAMQHYSDAITKYVILALFIPLVMSSGGNSGSQASTLIIQAMALGELTIRDWWRVMRREIQSGALLGAILGTIGYCRITLWQVTGLFNYGPRWHLMATTIFFALIGIVLWGSLMGSMLPIILKKIKQDPATSSAPFVATLVDVTGIVIYFSVAWIIIGV